MAAFIFETRAEKVKLLLERRKYALAEQEINQWLAADPEDSIAFAYLGLCFMKTGRFTEAHEAASRAIVLDPESDYNFRLQSLIFEKESNLPEAEKAARQSLTLHYENAFSHSLLARILFNQLRYDEALEAVNNGLQVDPEDVECLNVQARIFVRTGKPELAAENFRSSLTQDPENFFTHLNKGIALTETHSYNQAIVQLHEAIRLNPEHEFAKRYLLRTYKMRTAFYRFITAFSLELPALKISAKWLLLYGVWLTFKVSPFVLPFYLILFHFNLYNNVFFNLIISFNPESRKLLFKEEITQIKALGLFFLISAVAFGSGYFLSIAFWRNLGYIVLSFTIPLVSTFYFTSKKSLNRSSMYVSYMILTSIAFLILSYNFPVNSPHAGLPEAVLQLFNLLLIGYCWFRKEF